MLQNTAKTVGSGLLEVFATPAMIALMEKTASDSVAPHLEEGEGTVGVRLDVVHTAATPIGMTDIKYSGEMQTFGISVMMKTPLTIAIITYKTLPMLPMIGPIILA